MNFSPQAEADNVPDRMRKAWNSRIDQRCAELAVLIDKATKQELHSVFPELVESIFGTKSSFSWNLRRITHIQNAMEYSNVMNFLNPQGAIFKLIYALLLDSAIKYRFELAYLPVKVQQMLESSNINPFYNEIIQFVNQQSDRQICLMLNPFDYYIFHFAYHLINPCHQRVLTDENWNSAYFNLWAEYLLHFFPTDLDAQIKPLINYSGKNPMQSNQQFFKPYKQSTLLKQSLFHDPHVNELKAIHQQFDKHPRNEIWRSETILMAIIDLWLSNDQFCSQYEPLKVYPELPSGDYIRIIRMTVKHLHAFASTALIDHSALGDLKRHAIPMMQTRMYAFLRNLMHRWPLDESFRLVMELWLSFIQPWRYFHESYNQRGGIFKNSITNMVNPSGNPLEDCKYADENYLQFIAENLLVYSVVLQELLPRFTRIDLSSPRNAQMLFRLTKVFNQANLVDLLKKIESLVEAKTYSTAHHSPLNYSSSLSPICKWQRSELHSSTQIAFEDNYKYDSQLSKYVNLVRQKIYELEGPHFIYKPLFSANVGMEVYELLKLIKTSEEQSIKLLERSRAKHQQNSSIWSFFFNDVADVDEISVQDRQKAPIFLISSAEALMNIFSIPDLQQQYYEPSASTSFKSDAHSDNDSFPSILTPKKVKERLRNMKYQGDPDLMPIQSFEVVFLVRIFYLISTKLNEQYSSIIYRTYYSTTFCGRFCSHFLQDPMHVFKYEKNCSPPRRVMYHLPPRISFRKFAHKNFLLFIAGCVCLSIFLGWGWFPLIFVYTIAHLLKVLWKTTFFRRAMPTIELNFNESLDE